MLDRLKNDLVHISCGISDPDWIEACADEPAQLRVRINHLAGAKAQILTLLGVDSEEALLAHPAVKAARALSRVLQGSCQHIAHSGLSNDSRGLALSKEGQLYVAYACNQSIHVFSGEGPNGTHIKTLCAGQLSNPQGMAVDDDGWKL
jgi:hypothetical protein